MRGGAQGHLMRCSDGNFYVVKFRNNPQHLRVLANELLATRLAQGAELPVAAAEVVEVGDWLIEHTPELNIQLAGSTIRCQPGAAAKLFSREEQTQIAKPVTALTLHAAFVAMPHTDENDRETVLCYRSYFPARMASVY